MLVAPGLLEEVAPGGRFYPALYSWRCSWTELEGGAQPWMRSSPYTLYQDSSALAQHRTHGIALFFPPPPPSSTCWFSVSSRCFSGVGSSFLSHHSLQVGVSSRSTHPFLLQVLGEFCHGANVILAASSGGDTHIVLKCSSPPLNHICSSTVAVIQLIRLVASDWLMRCSLWDKVNGSFHDKTERRVMLEMFFWCDTERTQG